MLTTHDYTLTKEDLLSITGVEETFGTTRLLLEFGYVPVEFTKDDNPYVKIASDLLFHGVVRDSSPMELLNDCFGMEASTYSELCLKCVFAHLRSFNLKHQHKMAGVAYMLSKLVRVVDPSDMALNKGEEAKGPESPSDA